MKCYTWTLGSVLTLGLGTVSLLANPVAALAQAAPGSIHGHVQNAVGQPVTKGDVKLTTDKSGDAKSRKFPYSFPLDASGNFKGTGIAPGNYLVVVFQDDKSLDFIDSLDIKAGADATADFDMTRAAYIEKMSPEEKKALEDYKKKNADAVAANGKIANLNATLTQARADTKAGNYDAAITSMQQATTQKPDEPILWVALGDAQAGSADTAAKAAKAAGKPANDPAITQKYTDASTSYKKAIELGNASQKKSPETMAAAENQLGQVLAKGGDTKDAADAYDAAAKAMPANAGMYLFNEAATLYNSGKTDDAAVAADKAIAADPNRALAYYIKGQSLIGKASVDSKTQKITAPPGCVEAYQKYLDLDPNGPHAEEVKSILTGIGAQVKSTYRAGKK